MTTTSARPTPAKPGGPRPRAAIAAKTLRTDRWWLPPLTSGALFGVFVIYTGIRMFFLQDHFWVAKYHYLTPYFSPCVSVRCPAEAADFGQWLPKIFPIFPMSLISLAILTGFRLTCYYYRKAYYRSYWFSPPACAVAEPHKKYSGETRFPLLIQNAHRYFWYLAALLLLVNTWDGIRAFHGADGGFGIGLGTVIIWINLVMLWGYSVSCHACRHIVGGRLKHFSKHPVRYRMWGWVSKLNTKHMQWAWASLTSVMLTDLYLMAVAANWISDFRFFN